MTGHRERLISAGLVTPMTATEIARRSIFLARKAKGEKITNAPIFCVFRRDEPHRILYNIPGEECEDAELIANYLFSWEAFQLANNLNLNDKQQPPRPNPTLPPLPMYAMCEMSVWEEWEARRAQITMFALEGLYGN